MEKYYYENILTLTKSLATLYLNGIIESSNKEVRNLLEDNFESILKSQEDIYQQMKNDEFYNVKNVKKTDIKTVYENLYNN